VKGAFQTSREIFENPIWTDVIKFRIFFYIYGNAVFAKEGTRVGDIHLKRGQYLRSYRNLQNDLAYIEKRHQKVYSLHTIKSKIENLVKEKRIEIESTDYGTLFTVLNYEEYQGFERYTNRSTATDTATASEQQRNNNKNVNKDKNKDSLSPKDDQKEKVDYGKFIEWFNQKTGKRFKNVESNRKIIRARINEGYSKSELAKVVEFKSKQWKDDPKMNPYLRITTIFAPSHFGNYLNEANGYSKSSNISTTTTSDGQRQGKTTEEIEAERKKHAEEIARRAEERLNNEHGD
jgi:uncharacterized phage protein (TIGR02220 family)